MQDEYPKFLVFEITPVRQAMVCLKLLRQVPNKSSVRSVVIMSGFNNSKEFTML